MPQICDCQFSNNLCDNISKFIVIEVNRLGEMRDRSFEHQRYRASALNLVVAAIILWNTVYLEKAIQALRDHGKKVDDNLLRGSIKGRS